MKFSLVPRATRSLRVVAPLLILAACRREPEADPRLVSEWSRALYGAIRAERLSPPVASRLMVYASAAIYSGLAAADPTLRPLSGALNGYPEMPRATTTGTYDGTIAALAAERVVLDSLLREALPTTRSSLGRLTDSLELARAAMIDPELRDSSRAIGTRIGLALVGWSRSDGFDSTRGRPYTPRTGLGMWVNDAPASIYASQNLSAASEFVALGNPANILQPGAASDRGMILNRPKARNATLPPVNMAGASEPYWHEVRPFALRTWNECPVPPPPAFSTDTSSEFFRGALEVAKVRPAGPGDPTTIALYWADNAGESGTPVGHWISIASQLVSQRGLDAGTAARIMVQTAVAQADAFIASWGYKYQYSLIRPRTYIRAVIDSTWEPLIPTPPFPEYPSGHSTQSAAAATVLADVLGDAAFDDSTSVYIGHKVRRFDSFRSAADEAGQSRIYGGIHFPFGNSSGKELGNCVGQKVNDRFGKLR